MPPAGASGSGIGEVPSRQPSSRQSRADSAFLGKVGQTWGAPPCPAKPCPLHGVWTKVDGMGGWRRGPWQAACDGARFTTGRGGRRPAAAAGRPARSDPGGVAGAAGCRGPVNRGLRAEAAHRQQASRATLSAGDGARWPTSSYERSVVRRATRRQRVLAVGTKKPGSTPDTLGGCWPAR